MQKQSWKAGAFWWKLDNMLWIAIYASTDEKRLQDFQQALDNPEIKGIICTRGGYGSIRIIDQLDFSAFMKYPKWIVGFSDISVIHACLNTRLNVSSIHGPMTRDLAESEQLIAVSRLKEVLFGQTINYEIPEHPFNRMGKAEGMLIGGNLSILT
ncbi:LD-carboxypeptidase, partial [Bacteroidota bacterium]